MSDDTPIEGLTPWIASGALNDLLRAISAWYDESPGDAGMTIEIQPWQINPDDPAFDMRPALTVRVVSRGREVKSSGNVVFWRGASGSAAASALDACLERCRANRALREREGFYRVTPPVVVEVKPREWT